MTPVNNPSSGQGQIVANMQNPEQFNSGEGNEREEEKKKAAY
jgi:hypothetical protein